MATVTINPATNSDLPELLRIYNYYVLNSTATFDEVPLTETEMMQVLLLTNNSEADRYRSFTIKKQNLICGYAIISKHHPRSAYLKTANVAVYIAPEFVRQGFGGIALDFLEKWAAQHQFHVLIAIICAENESSIALFSKKGYFKCAHLKEVGIKFIIKKLSINDFNI
jgi:L-amino acid N-acyltransferase YncA